MDVKRVRCRNYTESEKETLLEIASNYSAVIECKKTDNVSVKNKNLAWANIASEFNATAQTGLRNGAQLKLLYEATKRRAKEQLIKEKIKLHKTGGKESVLNLDGLGEKCLTQPDQTSSEVQNVFDSNGPLGNFSRMDTSLERGDISQGVANSEVALIPKPSCDVQEPPCTSKGVPLKRRVLPLSPEQKRSDVSNRMLKKNAGNKEEVKFEILKLRRDKTFIEKQILECALSVKQIEVEMMTLSKREKEAEVKIKEVDARFKEQKSKLELQMMNLQNQSMQVDIQQRKQNN